MLLLKKVRRMIAYASTRITEHPTMYLYGDLPSGVESKYNYSGNTSSFRETIPSILICSQKMALLLNL